MTDNPSNNPTSSEDAQERLAKLRAELADIDTRFSSPEVKAEFDRFMAAKGYVTAAPGRKPRSTSKGQGIATPLAVSPKYFVPTDRHIVRYFLMEALWRTGFDIVLSEFAYMKNICDVMAVAGGRAIEYEIKASRDDYFADFKKTIYQGRPVSKHGSLAAGNTMMSRFYFVVPANMIDIRECPPHAGLIWYEMQGDIPLFRVVKRPVLLTKEYLSPGTWQTIAKRLMIRSKHLTERYVDTRFSQLKKDSIYAYRNPIDQAPDAR